MPKVTLDQVNKKLDQVLKRLKRIEAEEKVIEKEEEQELAELKKVEAKLEEVSAHPLRNLTYKDVAKGAIGAFVGTVAHYTFIYGIKIAHEIDIVRATVLFPLSFIIGGVFLYIAGFRKIRDPRIMWFLPVRLIVLYTISLLISILTLWLFQPDFLLNFEEAYKQVAAVTLTAVIGACTADLIGKE